MTTSLLDTVLLAALQGLTEALPLSQSGHAAVVRLWVGPAERADALSGVLHLGAAAAMAVAARRRLADAASEGVRAIARPALFQSSDSAKDASAISVASAASLAVGAGLRPSFEMWSAAPIAVGLGLVATGVAIASLRLAPSPIRRTLTLKGALAVGVVHGAALFPGASGVGAALTLLLWLGLRPARALDIAMIVTIPSLVVASAASLRGDAPGALPADLAALGLVIAFVSAAIGVSFLRVLLMTRRVAALALWLIPLGLATIAYARALPSAALGALSSTSASARFPQEGVS